ncbi:MAG TPA: DNA-3-methyladenine glycosylase 2 family protein, partial [Candidatus Eisenbacteria bacterium]|nr:DNA-3-methyladenine glycosylase 2 family protein [Candidatus Eisenbacteria bacterium]
MAQLTIPIDRPLDLIGTLGPLVRGRGDPTIRLGGRAVARTSRTAQGPAAIAIEVVGNEIRAEAWGPGAGRLLEELPGFLGLDDDAGGFDPSLHPLVAQLARRRPGIRLGRTGAVLESLVPAVLEQRITGTEAWRGFRGLVLAHGEPAPGPLGLRLPPTAEVLAGLPSWTFPGLG